MRLLTASSRLAIAGLALALVASAAEAAAPVILRHVMAAGGRRSNAGPFELTGTIGQPASGPVAGPMLGGTFTLRSGFWPGTGPIQCLAEYNFDGEIDILDFLDFIQDFSDCDQLPAPCGLRDPDINGDGTIDILDFLLFLDAFSNGC